MQFQSEIMLNVRDLLDVVENVNDVVELAGARGRGVPQERVRLDPYILPERSFRSRYRFSKEGAQFLTDILRPLLVLENNRGRPFTPEQIVCTGLDILGGGHFQRVEGVCSDSGTSTAHLLMYRFDKLF